ncbi:MAG: DEAD/DEAH box helicase [Rhodoferax sp.]|nr:DEAD/DEAH box helicase [Rhodoferax sp.]
MSTAAKQRITIKKTNPAEPRLSRTRKPPELDTADWQTALRRQFGREQNFDLKNLGTEPVFSDFTVSNPVSHSQYRVAIRGTGLGQNFCTCPDYATNDLGTCKHIEFTLGKLLAKRGGRTALARGFQPEYSEIWLDSAGQRRVRLRVGVNCPADVLAQARLLFDADAQWALRPDGHSGLPALLQAAQASGHDMRCHDDVWQFVAQQRDARQRDLLLTQAYPKGAQDKSLAKLLKVKLYPYQVEGALFAARAGRSLIGDEMGLGKTVQAIAAAELLARHFGARRVLVVCPTSLKHQWKNEFARFIDRDAQVIHGLRSRREQQYREDTFCKITHYETLARDADLIAAWAPDLVIADEAQRIKNWNTIAARALKRIVSPYAIVLTGTPLENRLEELISIVQFVDQHRLGPTWRMLDEHQLRDDMGRVIGYRALDRIGKTLAPVMLRRRKAEVLTQLPERVDHRIFVALTPEQRVHHDENGDIVTRIVARWRNTGYLSDTDQRRLHCALQNMRMACNSTYLLDHETDHGHKVDELMTLLDELFEEPHAKAVVFSQWLGTHELIKRRLAQRAWGHVLFSGSVPGDQRGALVEQFHADANCRLFLSTDAGGVGLNLQHAAAVVVNMDLPWNPAVLEQRIGRVHRMGQSRGVQVVNFVGQGSIEEGILGVLAFKKSLFAGVLDGGEHEVFMQGTRLSKFMESVEKVAQGMGEAQSDTDAAAEPNTEHQPAVEAADNTSTDMALEPAAALKDTDLTEVNAPSPLVTAAAAPAAATAADTPAPVDAALTVAAGAPAAPADPWAALLEAGAALLQGLAVNRGGGDLGHAMPAIKIERDPQTGQASVRLPLPDPAVLQKLAKAFEPWLR